MNWTEKNKNFLCGIRSFFGTAKIKNISQGKKKKAILIALCLVFSFLATTQSAHAAESIFSFLGEAFIKGILVAIQAFVGWLMAIAATLFAVVVDPNNISGPNGLLNKQAVKDVWIMVRDTLNMFFILVLLFSAFCTIFQVEKWNLKKVWLNILINALLVNFSFPIARFFIDISNVAMYYFINHLFSATGTTTVTGNTIFASLGATTNIEKIIMPGDFANFSISYQLAMIVFTFILAMTFIIIAVLFLIRLVALVIIVMFSPIGFVGYIFPSTSKYASEWWTSLFQYAFFGPIMIFMMSVAIQMAAAIGQGNFKSFSANAGVNTADASQTGWIASVAFYAVPIVILWMGLGMAKKMGIAGADMVVNTGTKWGKAAAMKMSGGSYLKKNYDAFKTKYDERQKDINSKRWGGKLGDKYNDTMDKGLATLGSTKAGERYTKRKEAKTREDIKKEMEGHDSLKEEQLYHQIQGNRMSDKVGWTDKDYIKAAALEKTALARGAKYADYVEKKEMNPRIDNDPHIMNKVIDRAKALNGGSGNPGSAPMLSNKYASGPASNKPKDIAKYQANVAREVAENGRLLADHKEKISKWKKAQENAEKEMLKDLQQESANESREIILKAEKG